MPSKCNWTTQLGGGVGRLVNVLPQSQNSAFGREPKTIWCNHDEECPACKTSRLNEDVQGLKSIAVESSEILQVCNYFLILSLQFHGIFQKHEAVAALPTYHNNSYGQLR